MVQLTKEAVAKLSLEERQALLELICELMAEERQQVPLSMAQKKLVRSRLAEHRKNPQEGEDSKKVIARLRARKP